MAVNREAERSVTGLDHLADLLRRANARAAGMDPSRLLPFHQLKESEQLMWLDRARTAAASAGALGNHDGTNGDIFIDPAEGEAA